jgi:hypothetical protein
MNRELLKVAIRYQAVVITDAKLATNESKEMTETTSVLMANCARLGFSFSEELLRKLNHTTPKFKLDLFETLKEVSGVNKNWTPLLKQWNIPTGESVADHVKTFFATVFNTKKGTSLPCGHLIPPNTFPIERYNGCPFCGTPFQFDILETKSLPCKLKALDFWNETVLQDKLKSLLESPTALDATQVENLKVLIAEYSLPIDIEVKMKETVMLVIDALVEANKLTEAEALFNNANDVLRYLWFKHTGFLQIVEPKTIIKRAVQNARNMHTGLNTEVKEKIKIVNDLKLKFSRSECKMYATWLNNFDMDAANQCELMHAKRGIWIRVIRALRLAEYAKRNGFENLAELLDVFYNEKYTVWQGRVNYYRLKSDADNTFKLLKQRPGLFARSLFSNMLWFGPNVTLQHFRSVMLEVPSRLILSLNMAADIYFDKNASRTVKPLGGISKRIPVNKMLDLYSEKDLNTMKGMIEDLSLELIKMKFKAQKNENKTIFIDENLKNIPISIGDRSDTIQDLPSAVMGTRFPVVGNKVRLFLQWGEGLPAQHLDMDLSCNVSYGHKHDFCSYSKLVIPGCKHSGDIQSIPNKVGTAEYIDLDLDELAIMGAECVTFTCNAYSNGSLTPNLVVGWMNSKFPMHISPSGVAYDPSAVQHQVRIKQTLTKGMVFGVLDVNKREIVWLEMVFNGQVTQNMDMKTTISLLKKVEDKLKLADLLEMKAKIQGLRVVSNPEFADEVYDTKWAMNTAEVNAMFLD